MEIHTNCALKFFPIARVVKRASSELNKLIQVEKFLTYFREVPVSKSDPLTWSIITGYLRHSM